MDDDGLAVRLTLAARVVHRSTAARLRAIGLHPGQERLLSALVDGPRSASELAAALDVEKPTVVRAVGRLEQVGALARTRGGHDDPRVVSIVLTPEGQRLERAARAIADAVEGQLQDALSPVEAATLEELLERLETAVRPDADGVGPGVGPTDRDDG